MGAIGGWARAAAAAALLALGGCAGVDRAGAPDACSAGDGPARARAAGIGQVQPVAGAPLTSPFGPRRGRMHKGLDFAAPIGAPRASVADGRVVSVATKRGYGLVIDVSHACGLVSRYAHLSHTGLRAGDSVRAGTVIGRVGETGNATGPHLHFEIHAAGRPFDPGPALAARPAGGATLVASGY